jgi:MFS family permease
MTAAIRRANRRTFSSLRRHRNYRLFFSGQIVSLSGTWMQTVAMAWLVLELTGSPMAVGLLVLCEFLPFTFLSLVAGVVIDRLDARRLVIGTQAASMGIAAALAALTFAGAIALWEVFLLASLRGIALVFDAPARQALTFQMVGPRELPNAVALNSSLFNAARAVGPAVAGLTIAAVGVAACFALNAVSFLAVLAGLLLMRVDELVPLERDGAPPTLVRGTREAIAYVRRTRIAGVVLLSVLMVSMVSLQFMTLVPVLAKETLGGGPEVFGVLTAFFGAGALVGALVSASRRSASVWVLVVGAAGLGIGELVLAPQRSAGAAALLLFGTGVCYTLFTANANATLQLGSPDHLRGRVVGLFFLAFNGSAPLGGLLAGWLAATGGTELELAVAGCSALVTAVAATLALGLDPRLLVGRLASHAARS